jgi:hypothetical protein
MITLTLLLLATLSIYGMSSAENLVGVFGVPCNSNLSTLTKAGLNSVIVPPNERDIERVNAFPLKKIGGIGISPVFLKNMHYDRVLVKETMDKQIQILSAIPDIYGYRLLGDALDGMEKYSDYAIEKYSLGALDGPVPFVGLMDIANVGRNTLLSLVDLYASENNVSVYHYPLMRRTVELSRMLKTQLQASIKVKSQYPWGIHTEVQTHPQDWYWAATKLKGSEVCNPLLYPDGQASMMLIYYAIAAGTDGFFVYNGHNSLEGKMGSERTLAIAQALLETKPLRSLVVSEPRSSEYVEIVPGKLYGSVLAGSQCDLIFFFSSDKKTVYYHPSTAGIEKPLSALLDVKARGYKQVYEYSPLGAVARSETENLLLSQEKPLVLLGVRGEIDPALLDLTKADMKKYLAVLKSRSVVLKSNIGLCCSNSLPEQPEPTGDLIQDCLNHLSYIRQLDEVKRNAWLARSPALPTNGEILKKAYGSGSLTKEMLEGQVLNFYW